MSKRLKGRIESELKSEFGGLEGVAVISPRGIEGAKNNAMRRRLHEKGLKMTVVKNTLARRAAVDSKIMGFESLLDGPSAVVFGNASMAEVARLLLAEKKVDEKLELRGIFFDGDVYPGQDGVDKVSKLPTREEAIGQILQALLGPGSNVINALTGPGSTLASILSSIEEKAEKQAPAPAAEATPAETAPAEAAVPVPAETAAPAEAAAPSAAAEVTPAADAPATDAPASDAPASDAPPTA